MENENVKWKKKYVTEKKKQNKTKQNKTENKYLLFVNICRVQLAQNFN